MSDVFLFIMLEDVGECDVLVVLGSFLKNVLSLLWILHRTLQRKPPLNVA